MDLGALADNILRFAFLFAHIFGALWCIETMVDICRISVELFYERNPEYKEEFKLSDIPILEWLKIIVISICPILNYVIVFSSRKMTDEDYLEAVRTGERLLEADEEKEDNTT